MLTVVLVLVLNLALQIGISYSATFGMLDNVGPTAGEQPVLGVWIFLRALLIMIIIGLWALNRKRTLFRTIIISNSLLTLGLAGNTIALLQDLVAGFSSKSLNLLLIEVFLVSASNILIFSIWY